MRTLAEQQVSRETVPNDVPCVSIRYFYLLNSVLAFENTITAALPRGWHGQVNDAGEMYYQNRHTEEWTQEVPEHPAAPEGWQALSHDEHGTYWFHEATQTTQWHHPHDAAPDAEYSSTNVCQLEKGETRTVEREECAIVKF